METVKDIVKLLLDYEWKYTDLGYSSEAPIVVLGPNVKEGDYGTLHGRSTEMRVCCCSSDFMNLPYDSVSSSYDLFSEKYENYSVGKSLDGTYSDGKGKENIIPDKFVERYSDIYEEMSGQSVECNAKKIDSLFKNISFEKEETYITALDFAVLAASNKFRKKNPEKDGPRGERWNQEIVLKKYIKNRCEPAPLLFFDEETLFNFIEKRQRVKANGKKYEPKDKQALLSTSCRPDLVVFDGTGFGLIELKYNARSMEKDRPASLTDHYLDFEHLIKTMKDIVVKEYIRRFWFLFRFEIVDLFWKDAMKRLMGDDDFFEADYEEMIKKLEKLDVRHIKIWSGLLFINDGSEKALAARKRSVIKGIKEQLEFFLPNEKMDIRYQIFEGETKDYVPDFKDLNVFLKRM